MALFEGNPIAFQQDSFTSSSTQLFPLGTRAQTRDGRVFRYCQMGAADGVAGDLYQSAAPIPNHLANTPPVVALGATSFSYTPGATGGAANLYSEGYLQVDTTPGNGYIYKVLGHAAIPASVLINGTPAITAPVVNSATTTGSVDKWTTAAADVAVQPLGHMMQVGVSTKNNFVFLQLAP